MPDPIIITDTWTGDDGDPWDPAIWPTIRNGVGIGGAATIQANAGRFETGSSDQSRLLAFTAIDLDNVDIVVRFNPVTYAAGLFPEVGWRIGGNIAGPGHPTFGYFLAWQPVDNEMSMVRVDDVGNEYAETLAFNHEPGIGTDPLWVRIASRGDRHRAKWWTDGDAEPAFWRFDATDATYATGRILLSLWNENLEGEVVGDWDDFTATEILPPDPGIRVGTSLEYLDALYVGDHQAVEAAYQGETAIPVP